MKNQFPKLINWIPLYGIIKGHRENKIHPLSMFALFNYNVLIFGIATYFIFLFGCHPAPQLMKVTTTKSGVSVSTVMPIDTAYANSLKDSADVEVEYLYEQPKKK